MQEFGDAPWRPAVRVREEDDHHYAFGHALIHFVAGVWTNVIPRTNVSTVLNGLLQRIDKLMSAVRQSFPV